MPARLRGWVAWVALLSVAGVAVAARQFGDVVVVEATPDDVYAAGRTVDVAGAVAGDVVAAARSINTRERIAGDAILAGENVSVGAAVGDDLRAVGRFVRVDAPVDGHAAVAAGELVLGPSARVGDWLWVAAGDVRLEGRVDGDVEVATGNLVIAGRVDGDVKVRGGTVRVLSGARIGGLLDVVSRKEPRIASRAELVGELRYTPMEPEPVAEAPGVSGNRLIAAVAVLLLALAPYLIFPVTSLRFAEIARTTPLVSLGIGLAVFAAAPVVIVVLMLTGVGFLLALAVLALYLLLIMLAIGAAALTVADLGMRVAEQPDAPRGLYVLALVIAVVALGVVGLVPYVGPLALFLLFLLGNGAVAIRVWRGLRGHALP